MDPLHIGNSLPLSAMTFRDAVGWLQMRNAAAYDAWVIRRREMRRGRFFPVDPLPASELSRRLHLQEGYIQGHLWLRDNRITTAIRRRRVSNTKAHLLRLIYGARS